MLAATSLHAGTLELKPETLKTWDEHIKKATAALEARFKGGGPFLWTDEDRDRQARVRNGEIVVWPADESNPKCVPSGLIHDWIGGVFIPNAHMDDLLSVVRDYARYKDVYKPGVVEAKLLGAKGMEDRFSMCLRNGSYITRTVIDGDFHASYVQLDERRWKGMVCSTQMQEIDDYKRPGERILPADEGHGYIWRMCGLSELEERDGGVYVNEEMIVLSRDLPAALRWIATPVIRRVARVSLASSFEKTRAAVEAKAAETSVTMQTGGSGGTRSCRGAATAACMR